MRNASLVASLFLVLALAACRDASDTPAGFHVAPVRLDACDPPSEVALTWNIAAAHPQVSEVQIWVNAPGEKPKLFAKGGPIDQAKTGAWARPGTTFALMAKGMDAVLFRTVLHGPKCS